MTLTELNNYHQPGYDILQAELTRCKPFCNERHPQHAEYQRALKAIEGAIVIREEMRKHLSPEPEPAQPALLNVPRKGGY